MFFTSFPHDCDSCQSLRTNGLQEFYSLCLMVDKELHAQLAWLRLCFQQVLHGAKHSIWHTGGCHSLLFPPSPHAITSILSQLLWVIVSLQHTCEHCTEVGAAGCQDHTVSFYLDIFCHNHHITQQLLTVRHQ